MDNKIRAVITTTILSQLIIDNIDVINEEYPELFEGKFRQRAIAFTNECGHLLNKIISPLDESHQQIMWTQIKEINQQLKTLLDAVYYD